MFKIADHISEISFNPEGIAEIDADEKKICIIKKDGELFACAAKCPHAAQPLSCGYIDSKLNIVCPLHSYKFSLRNGRNVSGEGYDLKVFPVISNADGIWLNL